MQVEKKPHEKIAENYHTRYSFLHFPLILLGDESIIKKLKAKYEAKDKDKNSTFDTCANTKSTLLLRSKKINASNFNTNTETTLNSQMLWDLSYKDLSIIKSSTPKTGILQEKSSSQPINQLTPKIVTFKAPDFNKIVDIKEKEIQSLEKVRKSLSHEIQDAVEYIEKNKDLVDDLAAKDKKIKELKFQLKHITQEIEQLKLWKKSSSIPHINDNIKLRNQRTNKREENTNNVTVTRVKSLSPRFLDISIDERERFKMYSQNPAKALIAQIFKSKTPKNAKETVQIYTGTNNRRPSIKNVQLMQNLQNVSPTSGHIKLKKQYNLFFEGQASPSPRKRVGIKKNNLEIGQRRQKERKEGNKQIDLREKKEKTMIVSAKGTDISQNYTSLLDNFVSLIERYKDKTEDLQRKNEELERKVKDFNDREMNLSLL